MSILGVIVRMRPADTGAVSRELGAMPGVDIALDPGDGRLIVVIEDAAGRAAATTLADIALLPQVLNTALAYEYSGPDARSDEPGVDGYGAWRSSLRDLARKPG